MNMASVIVRLPSHHKISQTNLSNRQAKLILAFYKSPCQLLLTLWAGTRNLAASCPQCDYCTYPILPPGHRCSTIPQFSLQLGVFPRGQLRLEESHTLFWALSCTTELAPTGQEEMLGSGTLQQHLASTVQTAVLGSPPHAMPVTCGQGGQAVCC